MCRWQCAIIAALALAHLPIALLDLLGGHDHVHGMAELFDLRREGNVPTFVSALGLCALASVAALHAHVAGAAQAARERRIWQGLCAAFAFAAVDEAAHLHEELAEPLRRVLGASGPLYFAWVVPYALATGVLALLAWRALRVLGAPARRVVLAGGALAAAGAFGCELVQGVFWTRLGPAASRSAANVAVATAEELLELLGCAVMLRGLLDGLAHRLGGRMVAVGLTGVEAAPSPDAARIEPEACMPRRFG